MAPVGGRALRPPPSVEFFVRSLIFRLHKEPGHAQFGHVGVFDAMRWPANQSTNETPRFPRRRWAGFLRCASEDEGLERLVEEPLYFAFW